MWKEDQYHGTGILLASNKYYFSGDFIQGERTVRKFIQIAWEQLLLLQSIFNGVVDIKNSL